MAAFPFFFLSLLIRAFLVGMGLFGAYVFWVLMAEVIWYDPILAEAAKPMSQEPGAGPGFATVRWLLILAYSLGILLSLGAVASGLWLIYKRLRGGIDEARYVAPETLSSRIVAAAVFGLLGLFFTLMSIGHLRTAVNVIITANFASTTEAVVVRKQPTLQNGKSIGPFVDVKIPLPDGAERLEAVLVPYKTYRRVEEGGTLAVLYWPQEAGGVIAEDEYTLSRVIYFSIKTMIVIALAIVGLSSFWVCVRGNQPPRPANKIPVARTSPGQNRQAGQFGKRA